MLAILVTREQIQEPLQVEAVCLGTPRAAIDLDA
jgi:hypothetical protein